MARMKPPIVPDQPVPVVPEDGLRLLLAACAGKDFEAQRDTAIVMFLLDTGARRAELADLQLGDLDLDLDVALVLGKGRRERALPLVATPRWRSTATCASGPGTSSPACRGCGWAGLGRSPPMECGRSWAGAARRPVPQGSTPTSCATRSRTPGWP